MVMKDYKVDDSIILRMPRVTANETRVICSGFVDRNKLRMSPGVLERINFDDCINKDKQKQLKKIS